MKILIVLSVKLCQMKSPKYIASTNDTKSHDSPNGVMRRNVVCVHSTPTISLSVFSFTSPMFFSRFMQLFSIFLNIFFWEKLLLMKKNKQTTTNFRFLSFVTTFLFVSSASSSYYLAHTNIIIIIIHTYKLKSTKWKILKLSFCSGVCVLRMRKNGGNFLRV